MNITIELHEDAKIFKMVGLNKDAIIETLKRVCSPIFEQVVEEAINYGYANNKFMYPMKDYLAYDEKSKEWAESFDKKVDKALKNEKFYVSGDSHDIWRNFVYWSGRHLTIALRHPEYIFGDLDGE